MKTIACSFLAFLALIPQSRAEAPLRLTHQEPSGWVRVAIPDESCRIAVLRLTVEARESVQGNLLQVRSEEGKPIGTVAFFSSGQPGSHSSFLMVIPRDLRNEAVLNIILRASNPRRPLTSGDIEVTATAQCSERDADTIPGDVRVQI